MPGIHHLSAAKIALIVAQPEKARKEQTIWSDGGGLYLRIRPNLSVTWFFAAKVEGRRRELGLGSAATVGAAQARERAGAARSAIASGRNPFTEHASTKATRAREQSDTLPEEVTFGAFSESYIADIESGFRNLKHRQQWKSTLRNYAAALTNKPIAAINTDDVLHVLRPIWLTKPETASRVRGRVEKVLSAAKARGLRPLDSFNPATWRGHLDLLLPRQSKLSRGHHAALPFAEAPAFLAALKKRPALAARALEFTILTAARTGETIGARWGEIDVERATWTVPAARMKASVEHVVPLSTAALALLDAIRPDRAEPIDIVFAEGDRPLSNMAMPMLLRRMDRADVTVHGFRSSFRDWAGDATDYPRDLIEQALAHTIQNKAERAYRRQTAVERRRELMRAWADYLEGATASEVDVPAPAREPTGRRNRRETDASQTSLAF